MIDHTSGHAGVRGRLSGAQWLGTVSGAAWLTVVLAGGSIQAAGSAPDAATALDVIHRRLFLTIAVTVLRTVFKGLCYCDASACGASTERILGRDAGKRVGNPSL